ncbi:MAG: hypothetical protein ACKVQT_26225 [Burkholderiales bacterium]
MAWQPSHLPHGVDARHVKRHYYESKRTLNSSGVVPIGSAIDFDRPHDRAHVASVTGN